MNNFIEKTIHSTPIYSGKVISVQVDDVQLPNGNQSKRELVKHPGAVAIIPFTPEGQMILVRQFRKALEKEIYEIPAGKLEKGEQPEACAHRELVEETGFAASKLEFVTSFYTSPGFADEIIYLYEAKELIEGSPNPDADEFVEVKKITLDEGLAMLQSELIHDAKTAFALMYWQNKELKEKQTNE